MSKDQLYAPLFLLKEYLKSKYECLYLAEISEQRKNEIKENFNTYYYHLDREDKKDFTNKSKKFYGKINENNYSEKINKIIKIIKFEQYLYYVVFFIFIIVFMFDMTSSFTSGN